MVASFGVIRRANYYTRNAADYYQTGADSAGIWLRGNVHLGVERGTAVDGKLFERLCAGRGASGKLLVKGGSGKRVAGVDVTLSSPKAVSVLWAIGDEGLRADIAAAEAEAVEAALQLIEREIPLARRGRNGAKREHAAFVAAVFSHNETRPELHADGSLMPSPQRHHHLCLPSVVQRQDGTWGAIDSVWVRSWKKVLGAQYRLGLATALQERGFAIKFVADDDWRWSIDGVPEDICQFFSPRRASIEEQLADAGTTSRAAPALAAAITLRSRREKAAGGDLTPLWRGAVERLGYVPESIIEAAKSAGRAANLELTAERQRQLIRARLEPVAGDLVGNQATFERRHLLESLANALVGTKAAPARVYQEAKSFLANGAICVLGETRDGPVLSTPAMVAIERDLVATASRLAMERVAGPSVQVVEQLAAEEGLSAEQLEVAREATSGRRLIAVQGIAGTGKTTTLRVIARAWERAGYRVIAASVAWRAANALGADLGVESRAIESWLARAEAGRPVFDNRVVVLVDESGLQSSPLTGRLLKQVEQAARGAGANAGPVCALVGDIFQLRPIGPGHAARLVRDAIGAVNLETIIRQRAAWARDMVHAFAGGDAKAGLEALTQRKLLSWHDGAKATVEALIAAWAKRISVNKAKSIALIARTNGEVRAINAGVRRHLQEGGVIAHREIALPAVDASGNKFTLRLAAGDRIRFLERNDRLGVINGTEGVVERVVARPRAKNARIVARVEDRRVEFSTTELAGPKGRVKLAHAYALTLFQAQGITVDTALVLTSTQFDRNSAYVAASRARNEVRFFADIRQIDAALAEMGHEPSAAERDQARIDYLAKQFARESIKTTTLDVVNQLAAREVGRERERIKRRELNHEL